MNKFILVAIIATGHFLIYEGSAYQDGYILAVGGLFAVQGIMFLILIILQEIRDILRARTSKGLNHGN